MISNRLRSFSRHIKDVSLLKRTYHFNAVPDKEIIKMATINPPVLRPYFNPILSHDDYFNLKETISVEDMFKARVHYGHKVGTLKDNMKWALFGERLGVCIFDLTITEKYMFKALTFLAHLSYQGGIILFITPHRAHMLPVEAFASELGQYSHTRKWENFTFSNSRKLFGAPIRLPDVVVFFGTLTSALERHPAIVECTKMAIPSVAIVDSNSDPNYITYPIPGNDDSTASFEYYTKLFRHAIKSGEKARKDHEKEYTKLSKNDKRKKR